MNGEKKNRRIADKEQIGGRLVERREEKANINKIDDGKTS